MFLFQQSSILILNRSISISQNPYKTLILILFLQIQRTTIIKFDDLCLEINKFSLILYVLIIALLENIHDIQIVKIMLNSEDFEVIQDLKPYNFKFLNLVKKENTFSIYQTLDQGKLVKVVTTNSHYLLQNIYQLQQLQLVDGPLGYLRKDTLFYMFMDICLEKTLYETIKQREKLWNKPYFDQHQIYQFINLTLSMLYISTQKRTDLEMLVLTPKNFVVIEKEGRDKIKFRFPIQEPILQEKGMIQDYLKQNKDFCSPELLRQIVENKNRKYHSKFGKSALYSLGLIILYMIFGEIFTEKQRIQSLADHRDFQNQVKFKRKQIKVLYDNKTVSKIVKILLQRKSLYRDDIRTLRLKLLSPQFKGTYKPEKQQESQYGEQFLIQHKTTRSFDDGQKIIPLQRQQTIQIQVMMKSGTLNNITSSVKGSAFSSTIKQSKLTVAYLPSMQDVPQVILQSDHQDRPPLFQGAQCFRGLQEVTFNFPVEEYQQQFSLSLKKRPSISEKDYNENIQNSMVSLQKSFKNRNNFSGLVQEMRKYKLISYLLFGLIVLMVGLCLLYLSLFSQE